MSSSHYETAKENDLDPYQYLLWLLQNAPGLSETDEAWAEKLLPASAPVRQLTDQLFCGTGSADSRPSGVPWSLTISTLYRAGGQAGAYLLLEYGEYDDAG